MKTTRTLYECGEAKVKGQRVYCGRGYRLSLTSHDGSLGIETVAVGQPLAVGICQKCKAFVSLGPPLTDKDRGWLKKKELLTK